MSKAKPYRPRIEPGHVILAASIDSTWSPDIAAGFEVGMPPQGAAGLSTSSQAICAALRGFGVQKCVAV